MASDYRIIADATVIYLNNSNGRPTSGGSATAQATTPWSIRSPSWTPQASVPQTLYAGGPPFQNGATPIAAAYPNVVETIPLVLDGGTHNTLVARLQQLRQLVSTTLSYVPAVLYVVPDGATQALYFDILAASIQESATDVGESPGEGATIVNVDLTITRSPHGGAASLTTLFTNTTFTNNGSGNTTALGTLTGDMVYEGSPLNLAIDGPSAATTDVGKIWLAACDSRVKTTHTTTVSTSGSTSGLSTATINAAPLLDFTGAKLALFVRFSSVTAGNKALFAVQLQLASGGVITPPTTWSPMPVTTGTTMVFAGTFNLASQRASFATAINLNLIFWLKSTDGTAVAYTVDYSEAVFAFTVCEISATAATYGNTTGILYAQSSQNLNSTSWMPLLPPRAYSALSGGVNANYPEVVRGRLPRAFIRATLYAAWIKKAGTHTTTDTLRITATHAPQYLTLRGAG